MSQSPKHSQDFYSDTPITSPEDDRFRRWPFAQRIGQTIAARKDASSLVIGIYGQWGDGKTTVLNFIEKELKSHSDVIVIRFNPWRFNSESQLLLGFFSLLAEHLQRSLKTKTEKIGDLLQKYGKLVTPLSLTLSGGFGIAAGSTVQDLGGALADVDIEELKKRIEAILLSERKRIVVMMDDIDRLDKQEVYSIFRLVKLTGDFQYTSYILAFDEQIVAASLGERYGTGDFESGRAFLEKIVQVPLNLPKADQVSLREVCFQGVDFALQSSEITLTDEQSHTFVRHFVSGLEFRLATPRLGKRYANALCFALPILRGEVDPVDLALIEGIRVFLPKLYELIKSRKDIFLGESLGHHSADKLRAASREVIETGLVGLSDEEKESVKDLIKALFPRTTYIFGNTHYGSEWEKTWSRHKKVASNQYYDRYFSYAIPSGDISDRKIEELLEQIPSLSESNLLQELVALMGDRSGERLLTKIWQHLENIHADSAIKLAKAIGKLGNKFPNPEHLFSSIAGPWARAGQLIGDLLGRSKDPRARSRVAISIMQESEPIEFACDIFRWLWKEEDRETYAFFGKVGFKQIGKAIAERIKKYAEDKPLYIASPKATSSLLATWRKWSSNSQVTKYLMSHLKKGPDEVVKFLSCYQPTSWGMGGLKSKGELDRSGYDSIAWTVDANKIYTLLLKIYGAELKDPKFHLENCQELDRQLAHQFAFIHLKVKEESRQKKSSRANGNDS